MDVETRSFIPKSTYAQSGSKTFYKEAGLGFLFKLAGAFLFLSLAAFGAAFWYKSQLTKEIEQLKPSVDRSKDALDPAFVSDAKGLVDRIAIAKDIVSNHRFPSHIFTILERLIYEEVRFTDYNYTFRTASAAKPGTGGFALDLRLAGEAKSYTALAKQAEIFKSEPLITSAVFSGFNLTSGGLVGFTLELGVNLSILSYD